MKKTTILYFFFAAFALVYFKSNAQENYVLDTDFDSGMWLFGSNSGVIIDNNEKIVAQGQFGTIDEDNFYNLIRLHANGSRDYSFPKAGSGGPEQRVSIIDHNNLYIYGVFTQSRCYNYYGVPCSDNEWKTEYYQPPYATTNLFPPSGFSLGDTAVIMVGGYRTDLQNPSRWQCIVRTNITGEHDSTFIKIEAEPNGPMQVALKKIPQGGYFMIGNFQSINGYTSPGIVKLTETFEIDTTFQSPFESTGIRSFNVDNNGRPWIGTVHAYFDNYQDTLIHLLRLNTDGSIDTTFNQPVFEGFANESSQQNGFSISGIAVGPLLEDEVGYIFGGTFGKVNGHERYCMVKLSETGEVMQDVFLDNLIRYRYSGSHPPKFYTYMWPAMVTDFIRLPDGKILVSGRFNLEINGHFVHNLMRLKKQSVNVDEVSSQKENILVYPNPTKDKLTISIPSHAEFANINSIDISDINGRIIRKVKWKAAKSEMDISGLKPGIYIFSFYADNLILERKKVVVSQ